MPTRLVLVPNDITTRRTPEGGREEIHTPNFFGVSVQEYTLKTDYRDCSKVVVSLPDKQMNELVQKSREHFTQLWGPPVPPSSPL